MKKFVCFLGLILLAGCVSSGTHVLTGKSRPAISFDSVKIYDSAPANSEIIGLVNSFSNQINQSGQDKAIFRLKSAAAQMGANGIIITKSDVDGWKGTSLSGQAIFVP